jgi:hypothetical protein
LRILDVENDKALNDVTLYLTISEAKELLGDLQDLINKFGRNEHAHINDTEFNHELTLVLYDEQNLVGFDERSKKLIKEDK